MTQPSLVTDQTIQERLIPFPKSHFLAASDLNPFVTPQLLDLADAFVDFNRQSSKALDVLHGRTVVNLFFENSTRTSSSFEIAAKRLGADVVTMPVFGEEGRDPDRHGGHPERHEARHSGHPPLGLGRC
jgi:aspartate carbamoyltransferase catalytic subunit